MTDGFHFTTEPIDAIFPSTANPRDRGAYERSQTAQASTETAYCRVGVASDALQAISATCYTFISGARYFGGDLRL